MIKTPLYEQVLQTWDEHSAEQEVPEPIQEHDRESMVLMTREGVKISYQQLRKNLPRSASTEYVEFLTVEKKDASKEAIRHFYVQDGKIYLRRDPKAPQAGRADEEYKDAEASVKGMLEHILEAETNTLIQGLTARHYNVLRQNDSDRIYFLIGDALIYFGNKEFTDALRCGGEPEAAMRDAYKLMKKERWIKSAPNIAAVMRMLPERGRIALFTKDEYVKELIVRAEFDEEALARNVIRIGELEIMPLGQVQTFTREYLQYVFTPATKTIDFLATRWCQRKEEIQEAISTASASRAVRMRPQIDALKKRMREGGLNIPDVLSDDEQDFFNEITSEFSLYEHAIKIYEDHQWWSRQKEAVGLVFDGTLDDKLQETRQADWRKRFVDAVRRSHQQLDQNDYSMFLQISEARQPGIVKTHHAEHRRVGLGNMIVDFGGKEVLGRMRANMARPCAEPDLAMLERFYDQNRKEMRAYLFRGNILEQMLKRIIPGCGSGEKVAVDTCKERVEEMSRFCSIQERTEGRHTLLYEGVEMVLVNEDAIRSLEEIVRNR
jgi:hypothetical protein